MSIDALPVELLVPLIAAQSIPLHERFCLRGVSRRFKFIIESELAKKTSLVIRDDTERELKKSADDLVLTGKYEYFNNDLFTLLARLYPDITHLTVSIDDTQSFAQVPMLLEKYCDSLTSLSLAKFDGAASASEAITDAINALTGLTRLGLFMKRSPVKVLYALAPTFARLEGFTYEKAIFAQMAFEFADMFAESDSESIPIPDDPSHASIIFSSLSPRCSSLKLQQNDIDWSSNLISTITHLHLFNFNQWKVRNMMENLQSLSLDFYSICEREMGLYPNSLLPDATFCSLSRLPQLTELRLLHAILPETPEIFTPNMRPLSSLTDLYLGPIAFGKIEPIEQEESDNEDDDSYEAYLDRLNTHTHYVKVLLQPEVNIHLEAYLDFMAIWFPRLERLTIKCHAIYHEQIYDKLDERPFSVTLLEPEDTDFALDSYGESN